jgi:hypothetical protein
VWSLGKLSPSLCTQVARGAKGESGRSKPGFGPFSVCGDWDSMLGERSTIELHPQPWMPFRDWGGPVGSLKSEAFHCMAS